MRPACRERAKPPVCGSEHSPQVAGGARWGRTKHFGRAVWGACEKQNPESILFQTEGEKSWLSVCDLSIDRKDPSGSA